MVIPARHAYSHLDSEGNRNVSSVQVFSAVMKACASSQDTYHDSYTGAPADGGAWVTPEVWDRVLRWGGWADYGTSGRSACRLDRMQYMSGGTIGIRPVK